MLKFEKYISMIMKNHLSETERIRTWKHTNEERLLRQWNKKNLRFFWGVIFSMWGFALIYLILYGFHTPLTTNYYFYFALFYPLLMGYIYRKRIRTILRKRKEELQKTKNTEY